MKTARAVSLIAVGFYCLFNAFSAFGAKYHQGDSRYLFAIIGNLLCVAGFFMLLATANEKRNGPKGRE